MSRRDSTPTLPRPRASLPPPSSRTLDDRITLVPCPACAQCRTCGGTGIGMCPRCEHRTVSCGACAACPFCHGVRAVTAERSDEIARFIDDAQT